MVQQQTPLAGADVYLCQTTLFPSTRMDIRANRCVLDGLIMFLSYTLQAKIASVK